MTYSVSIKRSALKALERIPREDRLRVIEAIDKLSTNPSAGGVLKGELGGLRRIRVGVYRVVYELRDEILTVLVVRIGHRRDIYR
ncbi:type II toxin-antitoxin system RelE/ParE family toxin [Thioalkalivibrio sp. XN279]|jgi:mRNA interferase RelE/StbE|uniref:type II toxin-antitoxin system RelE family toxin n=1 Tax=Thioalkalivibrio sp. XN279 TaxID=2714953 RepID=UPI00140E600B|nr:type II toxin-antitoxin system RelE/ParE family toxin [Thioalkalivibrio sp. XN279]NHA15442.1 type II toxin-antitoxin system RelE/ParE family toxin [Thioalkalivibrio sp. XN279]